MTTPFIIFKDVTLSLNGRLLFEDTNWTWQSDQHWAIIGPNGSGKSTLAKAVCRQIPLHQGRIEYFFDGPDGQPFFNRNEIVMISPGLHQEIMRQYGGYHQARWQSFEGDEVPSVADFLSGKSIEHVSPYEVTPLRTPEELYLARREKAVELLELRHLLARKIHQLSNGESRKVLIARALMHSPKLLILDDPFAGLDYSARELMQKAVAELLTDDHIRILLTTSRIEEIPQGITHCLHVAGNRVVGQGPKNIILESGFMENNFQTNNITDTIAIQPLEFPFFRQDFTAGAAPLVEMENVSVAYNGVPVLSGITWTMRQGERWALLGHNGAGKSTLLSLILADNPQAYANQIRLFGKRRGSGESIWEIKERIGWVAPELQTYYANGCTGHEVVCSGFFDSIGLYRDCSPEQIETALEWMRLLNISHLAGQSFKRLSLGEQRLILLARALVKKPALLILDEPCQGLDYKHRMHINNLLDQLCNQTPVGMIYVTHYFDEMPRAITHILKLQNGRIIESKPVKADR